MYQTLVSARSHLLLASNSSFTRWNHDIAFENVKHSFQQLFSNTYFTVTIILSDWSPEQDCTCIEKEVGGRAYVQTDIMSLPTHAVTFSGADLVTISSRMDEGLNLHSKRIKKKKKKVKIASLQFKHSHVVASRSTWHHLQEALCWQSS